MASEPASKPRFHLLPPPPRPPPLPFPRAGERVLPEPPRQPPLPPFPPLPLPPNGEGEGDGRSALPSPRALLPPAPPSPGDALHELVITPHDLWEAIRPQWGRERPMEKGAVAGFAASIAKKVGE